MIDLKERFNKLSGKWKWGLVGIGVLLAAPFAYLAFWGVYTIAMLIVGFVLVSGFIAAAPVWSMKLANWQMKAVIEEATKNPIETRWNNYRIEEQNLTEEGKKIERFETKIKLAEKQLRDMERDYGLDDPEVKDFRETQQGMVQLCEFQWSDFQEAQAALKLKHAAITKMERLYSLALAQQDAAATGAAKLTVLQKVAEQAAITAADERVAASMAQLQRRLKERIPEKPTLALPRPAQPDVVVLPATPEKAKVR